MILTPPEIDLVFPMFELLKAQPDLCFKTVITTPSGRTVTITIAEAGIIIEATFPDSAPAFEFYRMIQGFTQAYRLNRRI